MKAQVGNSTESGLHPQWYTQAKPSPIHEQCEVYHLITGKTVAVTYSDEQGDNARLIAAAPDLLEACKLALDMLNDPNADEYFDAAILQSALELAIEKATT